MTKRVNSVDSSRKWMKTKKKKDTVIEEEVEKGEEKEDGDVDK